MPPLEASQTVSFEPSPANRVAMVEPKRGDAPPRFEVGDKGLELLKLLSDLASQEDNNLWLASGLFAAADGVLVLAAFTTPIGYFWVASLAIFGFVLTFGWMVAIQWARARRNLWERKAKDLQGRLGIPPEFAPWGDKQEVSVPNWAALMAMNLSFYVMWALVLLTALQQLGVLKHA